MPHRFRVFFLALALELAGCPLFGAWEDDTTGLPLLEVFSAKGFGADEYAWISVQDQYGRLFVGGDKLQIFDGQGWQSYPIGKSYALRALAFGEDGRLWAGAINEVGYFEEETLGVFKYHSLVPHLPKELPLVGDVWGCAAFGRISYFICGDKILRWDGTSFQIQNFAGATRLFPIRLGDEYWFHHRETGLYRLTEAGPHLDLPASQLPKAAILGLARDKDGLLLATGSGLFRPGGESRRVSGDELSQYMTEHRLASFVPLATGGFAIGTAGGGLVITDPKGTATLRVLDSTDGLPNPVIFSIRNDSSGYAWCTTPTGVFNFEGLGQASGFGPLNGLKGQISKLTRLPDGRLLALTFEGVFQLEAAKPEGGRFKRLSQLSGAYNHVLPVPGGMLFSRHAGMDFFDGTAVREILPLTAQGVFFATALRADPAAFYLSDSTGLSLLVRQPGDVFTRTHFLDLPDASNSLHEDTTGRLWLGTVSQGALVYDPAKRQVSCVNDPANGEPLSGHATVFGTARGILIFLNGRVLQARPDGTGLQALAGFPAVNPQVELAIPGGDELLIAFKRMTSAGHSSQGLGVLTVGSAGEIRWRELDVPPLRATGFVSTMEFTEENGRPILWIGGTEGTVRLDYDKLPVVTRPDTPFIRLDTLNAGWVSDIPGFSFSFRDHHLKFRVFTGEYTRTKDWLVQSRLGSSEWSAPTARRAFEFSSLSEGDYRFEVRAVNPAGLVSEPSVFAFHILPPWYRSGWALAGYAVVLGLGIVAVIRVRERRIRARNEQLEALVAVRTAELVKANAAKDEFLAGISHEIRNPMNGVIGIADNFRIDGLDQESRRKFSLLRQCAAHLSSLLEDILDFSKVQAGAVEIETRPFDLPELMDSIAAMTAADSEKRGIPVEIAISPAVPAKLVGDPKRVRQILLNFVSNALKFSGRGQVSVTVWCKTPSPASTEVIFAVSDEGPGISPEEQKRLFTRFERGAAALQGRVPGTGLGLALCKGLAEKMGGRIWLESEPGQGSCFSFSAPFPIAEPAAPVVTTTAVTAPSRTKQALVVDDQEYNRVVLTDLLEALGFTVHNAGDGTAALALASREDLDAVFLDYNLPGLSGLEVARGIRALPNKSAQAIILATTAFSTPEKRNQCLAAGMNAFLGKPVTMERLRKALASALPGGVTPTPATPSPPPADGLSNLRLLARKKGVPFAGELALYLSEFEVEFDQLNAAVQAEDVTATARCAHLLYGRCAFIAERELEQAFRKIEADAATGHWADVRLLLAGLAGQVAGLRIRLVSSAPVAPPA